MHLVGKRHSKSAALWVAICTCSSCVTTCSQAQLWIYLFDYKEKSTKPILKKWNKKRNKKKHSSLTDSGFVLCYDLKQSVLPSKRGSFLLKSAAQSWMPPTNIPRPPNPRLSLAQLSLRTSLSLSEPSDSLPQSESGPGWRAFSALWQTVPWLDSWQLLWLKSIPLGGKKNFSSPS